MVAHGGFHYSTGSRNVRRGLHTKAETGWFPGAAPLGYLNRHGPYYQVNYVYAGKKTAYYVQPADPKTVRREMANYKKFRRLINQWIGLTVHLARIKQKRTR